VASCAASCASSSRCGTRRRPSGVARGSECGCHAALRPLRQLPGQRALAA
jgi:hypothetical protein